MHPRTFQATPSFPSIQKMKVKRMNKLKQKWKFSTDLEKNVKMTKMKQHVFE